MNFKALLLLLCMAVHKISGDCHAGGACWGDELRIAKLESLVDRLNSKVGDLTANQVQLEAELKTTEEMVKSILNQCSNSWTLKRTKIVFPKLEKLALSNVTPTYVEALPVPLPNNTRALVVQVFCNFWNGDGHAYLDVDIQQEGNEDGGVASVENTHFRVYANTFYYEVMVPWDSSISDKIQFKVKRSKQTGGSDNWYRLRVVGYILA